MKDRYFKRGAYKTYCGYSAYIVRCVHKDGWLSYSGAIDMDGVLWLCSWDKEGISFSNNKNLDLVV